MNKKLENVIVSMMAGVFSAIVCATIGILGALLGILVMDVYHAHGILIAAPVAAGGFGGAVMTIAALLTD